MNVSIVYRVFIPSPAVRSPLPDDFGGDNRDFSEHNGTSRAEINAKVTYVAASNAVKVDNLLRSFGESASYDSSDTSSVDGKPSWWLGLASGAMPTKRKTLDVTDTNLNLILGPDPSIDLTGASLSEKSSAINLKVEAANPLLPVFDIDAHLTLMFRESTGTLEIRVIGIHDGFPAHELYSNSKLIYKYDPVLAGGGPITALPGRGEIDVDTGWVQIS